MKSQGTEIELVLKVKKDSESGLFSNNRLLVLKSGFISYFSKQPKGFVGNVRSLEMSGELPKYTLSVSNVKAIKVNTNKIQLDFQQRLIDRNALQMMIQKDADFMQSSFSKTQFKKWNFNCNSKAAAQEFVREVQNYLKDSHSKPSFRQFIGGYRAMKQHILYILESTIRLFLFFQILSPSLQIFCSPINCQKTLYKPQILFKQEKNVYQRVPNCLKMYWRRQTIGLTNHNSFAQSLNKVINFVLLPIKSKLPFLKIKKQEKKLYRKLRNFRILAKNTVRPQTSYSKVKQNGETSQIRPKVMYNAYRMVFTPITNSLLKSQIRVIKTLRKSPTAISIRKESHYNVNNQKEAKDRLNSKITLTLAYIKPPKSRTPRQKMVFFETQQELQIDSPFQHPKPSQNVRNYKDKYIQRLVSFAGSTSDMIEKQQTQIEFEQTTIGNQFFQKEIEQTQHLMINQQSILDSQQEKPNTYSRGCQHISANLLDPNEKQVQIQYGLLPQSTENQYQTLRADFSCNNNYVQITPHFGVIEQNNPKKQQEQQAVRRRESKNIHLHHTVNNTTNTISLGHLMQIINTQKIVDLLRDIQISNTYNNADPYINFQELTTPKSVSEKEQLRQTIYQTNEATKNQQPNNQAIIKILPSLQNLQLSSIELSNAISAELKGVEVTNQTRTLNLHCKADGPPQLQQQKQKVIIQPQQKQETKFQTVNFNANMQKERSDDRVINLDEKSIQKQIMVKIHQLNLSNSSEAEVIINSWKTQVPPLITKEFQEINEMMIIKSECLSAFVNQIERQEFSKDNGPQKVQLLTQKVLNSEYNIKIKPYEFKVNKSHYYHLLGMYRLLGKKIQKSKKIGSKFRIAKVFYIRYKNYEGLVVENPQKTQNMKDLKLLCQQLKYFFKSIQEDIPGLTLSSLKVQFLPQSMFALYINEADIMTIEELVQAPIQKDLQRYHNSSTPFKNNFQIKYLIQNLQKFKHQRRKIEQQLYVFCNSLKPNGLNSNTLSQYISTLNCSSGISVRFQKYLISELLCCTYREQEWLFEDRVQFAEVIGRVIEESYYKFDRCLNNGRICESKSILYWQMSKLKLQKQSHCLNKYIELSLRVCQVALAQQIYETLLFLCHRLLMTVPLYHIDRANIYILLLRTYCQLRKDKQVQETFQTSTQQIIDIFGEGSAVLICLTRVYADYLSLTSKDVMRAERLYLQNLQLNRYSKGFMCIDLVNFYIYQKQQKRAAEYARQAFEALKGTHSQSDAIFCLLKTHQLCDSVSAMKCLRASCERGQVDLIMDSYQILINILNVQNPGRLFKDSQQMKEVFDELKKVRYICDSRQIQKFRNKMVNELSLDAQKSALSVFQEVS